MVLSLPNDYKSIQKIIKKSTIVLAESDSYIKIGLQNFQPSTCHISPNLAHRVLSASDDRVDVETCEVLEVAVLYDQVLHQRWVLR